MRVYSQAILPKGFKANAVACGIKRSGKLDLALFYSLLPAKAAARFTTNTLLAAPVKISKFLLQRKKDFYAILANSGNANAFNGRVGVKDAWEIARAAAAELAVEQEDILLASTGIIGKRLPIAKIKNALPELVSGLSGAGINLAKRAILTTDTFTKEATVKFKLGARPVTICGIAKGAGMIAPQLATMLCFIFTDARISRRSLDQALVLCVEESFNRISVDGCMSTNDSVMLLANAASRSPLIEKGRGFALFVKGLGMVCHKLAEAIVRDAEGATKFIRIEVRGAATASEAKKAALAIANSALFKSAIYGASPNILGRIAASVGASGVGMREEGLSIKYTPLKKKEVHIEVNLRQGRYAAVVYTTDLTPEYVKINAQYN
jgi:glutamate N-acetyltransferase/amino-acid N-acetyltransferase